MASSIEGRNRRAVRESRQFGVHAEQEVFHLSELVFETDGLHVELVLDRIEIPGRRDGARVAEDILR